MDAFYRSLTLARIDFKRKKWQIVTWIISIAVVIAMCAYAFTDLYPKKIDRLAMGLTMKNPAIIALTGPGYGLSSYSYGAMTAQVLLMFAVISVGIMNIIFINSYLRADEESGRKELVNSKSIGRLATVFGAFFTTTLVNFFIGLITMLSLIMLDIDSMDIKGSILFGSVLFISGVFFTCVTIVISQLIDNSRDVAGVAYSILGIFYLMRLVGDLKYKTLSAFSPLGLVMKTQVYVNNYIWPLLILTLISIGLLIVSMIIQNQRDYGEGIIKVKPGKGEASGYLKLRFGLPVRLNMSLVSMWVISIAIFGACCSAGFTDFRNFIKKNNISISDTGKNFDEQYLVLLISMIMLLSVIPVVQTIFKLKNEEKEGRIENILTRSTSRVPILGSYLGISLFSSIIIPIIGVLILWWSITSVQGLTQDFEIYVKIVLIYLPCIWLFLSLATLVISYLPKFSSMIWLYLVYSFVIIYLGPLIKLNKVFQNTTPFGLASSMSLDDIEWWKLVSLVGVSIVLVAISFIRYKNRDILEKY